jgi:hypothetical protein
MLPNLKNKRTNGNELLKVIYLTTLLLGGALQAMDAPSLNEELWQAAEVGNLDQVAQLIDKGADVNAKDQANGWTPLMIAAKNEHLEICILLIKKGADVNSTGIHNVTALGVAHDYEICKLFIDNGANVNATDELGTTTLIAATILGSIEKCKLLIDNGANVNVRDQWGMTPLTAAAKRTRNRNFGPMKAKELCELIIDALLKAPMNQTQLKPIHLTPKQKSEIYALTASLKRTPIHGLHHDTRRLIIEDVRNSFKRRNFIEEQIVTVQDPLRQELLDYLNSRIQQMECKPLSEESMPQYPNVRGITWDEALGTFE